MKRWWVITYPTKCMDKIEHVMEREEFDIIWYCPTNKISVTYKGLVRVKEVPLFPGYMFWYYDRKILTDSLLKEHLPFRLVRFDGKPRYISDDEIKRIEQISLQQTMGFNLMHDDAEYLKRYIGRNVVIRDGVFSGMYGVVKEVRRAGRLAVEMVVFNRPLICEVTVDYVELS